MSPIKWFIAVALVVLAVVGFYVFVPKDEAETPSSEPRSTETSETAEQENTTDTSKTFTAAQVAEHNSESDCWTIINGKVYDVTDFVSNHPGGQEILRACGIDASSLFNSRTTSDGEEVGSGTPHSSSAQDELQELLIGTLAQ